jgi:hypothetical protein
MKEIWKASINPHDWKSQSVPSLLGWWWFFCIVSNMLGYASFSMARKAEQINDLIAVNVVTLLSYMTGIPLSLIVLTMVSKVYKMQLSHYKQSV